MSEAGESEKTDRSERYVTGAADAVSKVFISYGSQDATVAERVCAALEAAGLPCWIAPRDVRAGESYAAAIVEAISSCRMLVLVLSQGAINSPHVLREVERASSKRRPVLSVRMDVTKLPPDLEYFLSANQWLDASGKSIEQILPALVESVRNHAGGMSGQALGATDLAARSASGPVPTRAPGKPSSRWGTRAVAIALAIAAIGLAYVLTNKFWLSRHTAAEKPTSAATNVTTDKSIAVLPFVDLSEKHDQEYFAEGMAEEVLDLLANIPGLKVIGRTSSFQFKGKSEDLRAIGNALGVSYVVEGSVRKSGERIRVTAQLINAQDGSHLWSNTYDEQVGDTLKVQDQIASNLARALQVTVGADYQLERPFKSPEAYDLYLRGRHAYDRADKEGLESAAAYFQQVLEIDPTSIPALEWLATAQLDSAGFGYVEPHEGFEETRRSAQRVLGLDPKSSAAHATLAWVHLLYDWDWAAAERDAKEALRLRPRNPAAIGTLGKVYVVLGLWNEAARLLKTALTLDPLAADWYVELHILQLATGRLSEAESTARKILRISPTYGEGHLDLGETLLLERNLQGALAEMQQEQTDWSRDVGLAMAYHALGRRAESDAALARVVQQHAQDDAWEIADAYASRGELDQAFAWLERAYSQKDAGLYMIKDDPFFKNLTGDPRYKAFLRKMNLPE